MDLFSWDAATLLMHFCTSWGLLVSHQLQAQPWRCLRGCSLLRFQGALGETPCDCTPRAPRASCYCCSYEPFLGQRPLEPGDQMAGLYLALSLPGCVARRSTRTQRDVGTSLPLASGCLGLVWNSARSYRPVSGVGPMHTVHGKARLRLTQIF